MEPAIEQNNYNPPNPQYFLKAVSLIVLGLFIIGLVIAVGYIIVTNNKKITTELSSVQPTFIAQEKESVPISPTDDWETVYFKDIAFKIPDSLSFTPSEERSSRGIVHEDGKPDESLLTISVRKLRGGTLEEDYLGDGSNDCDYISEEALFGTFEALQLAASTKKCGNAGAILATINGMLVSVRNLTYDPGTKEITRDLLRDTLVSTIEPIIIR
jgi:hypothetical protein